ncbi:hypothetical protein HIM_04068 [Hirsutella minnesotensis 3608]|uniref:Adenylate kinase n=1 Tax=Hirsutella minnesotensis 3608 TaxID=1043627 RepID=A0A0F8A253_9HYPO|nr:hypothetical protein HIM_04068 [Hirsutella minnesotensis 3608]
MAARISPFAWRPAASARCAARTSRALNSPSRLQSRLYSSEAPGPGGAGKGGAGGSRIKFWPFAIIIGLGSAGYVSLVNRRKEIPAPAASQQQQAPQLPAPDKPKPTFSPARLHAPERPGSQFGDLIRSYIKDGLIVPMEVTVQLLENAMVDALSRSGSAKGRFLVDGFPRKMDQAHRFEEAVCPARLVLFYDCPEAEMQRRLLERGKTSGRADDNAESIRKRFRTFVETSMPVVDYYDKQGRVVKIDATATPDNVFADTEKRLVPRLGSAL